jgi:2-dehydro-3-deoxygluconokinase
VFYDRAGSAFALSSWDDFDWKEGLAGADWLHLSGITPTLGSGPARAVLQAAAAAKTVGAKVSFDGNHRAKLWETAPLEAAQAVRRLYELADLLFADHRDIGLALGRDFTGEADPFAAAAEAAFEAFPALGRMACTRRTQHSVDHHDLTARLATRTGVHSARHYALPQVVDRIGAGDAFCAGFLFAEMTGRPDAECLDFALAAAALKHSLPGDFNLASERDVAAALCEGGFQVRR